MNGCNQWYLWLKWMIVNQYGFDNWNHVWIWESFMIVNVNIQPIDRYQIDFIEWRYVEMNNHCKEMLMDSVMYQCSLYQMNWYEWINNSILNEWMELYDCCMNIHDSIKCIDFFNNHCLWIVDYENVTIDSFWYFHQFHKWYWMNEYWW